MALTYKALFFLQISILRKRLTALKHPYSDAFSLPVYVNEETNLPLGIQLWGPKNSEIELLKVAEEFEEAGQFILPKAYQ